MAKFLYPWLKDRGKDPRRGEVPGIGILRWEVTGDDS